MATLMAVVCLLVILALTTVAVAQSIGGLSSFAQSRKLLQTVDSAEAGIQSEITAMEQWLSSPTVDVPCAGGSTVPGLPAGQGWVSAGASSSDSVVDSASLGYYSLSVAALTTAPTGAPTALPASSACYGRAVPAPATTPWYLLVQSQGVSSSTSGGSTATGRTLQALLRVNEPTLAAHHRHGGRGAIELIAFHATAGSAHTSNASAQAVNFNPLSTPASTASYAGSGPSVASSSQPSAIPFTTESWLTLGALAQYAEADSSGSSVACSGIVASPGTIPVGATDPSCSPSGSPSAGGVQLDLSTIPAVGNLLSPLADVTLQASAITSSASMGPDGAPVSGSVLLGNIAVRVKVPLGVPVTIPVTVASGPNQDLLSAVTAAITSGAPAIGPVTSTLVAALQSTFTMQSNYQTSSGGVFSVSAIHLTVPTAGVTADLAVSTVGPNGSDSLTIVWIKQVP